jgi:CPA1 family monovalent cation:H+ antiporter
MAWAFAQAYIPRRFLRERAPWSWITIIGWTGLRGIVSLAAALALPIHDDAGEPFPRRAAIIFITFCVIVVTLVGQGLSLIPLLKWLNIDTGEDTVAYEAKVRVKALRAGLAKLEEMSAGARDEAEKVVLARSITEYQSRIDHLEHHTAAGEEGETPESRFDHHIQEEAIAAERRAIAQLRDDGKIPDEIFRKVQYDLDLAVSRLF